MKKYLFLCTFWLALSVSAQTLPTVIEKENQKIFKYPDGRLAILSDEGILSCNGKGDCFHLKKGEAGYDDLFVQIMEDNTIRLNMMEQSADLKSLSLDGNKATMDISNPNGLETAPLTVENKGENAGEMVVKDKKTGQTLVHAAGQKDNYIKIKEDFPNKKVDLDLKRTGVGEDDFSGQMKYTSETDSFDLKVINGRPTGTVRQVENGYEQLITMYSDGAMKLVVNDAKTHKTLYTAYGTEKHMQLFDAKGKVVAEGFEDDMKIYDKVAYEKYEKIMSEY